MARCPNRDVVQFLFSSLFFLVFSTAMLLSLINGLIALKVLGDAPSDPCSALSRALLMPAGTRCEVFKRASVYLYIQRGGRFFSLTSFFMSSFSHPKDLLLFFYQYLSRQSHDPAFLKSRIRREHEQLHAGCAECYGLRSPVSTLRRGSLLFRTVDQRPSGKEREQAKQSDGVKVS